MVRYVLHRHQDVNAISTVWQSCERKFEATGADLFSRDASGPNQSCQKGAHTHSKHPESPGDNRTTSPSRYIATMCYHKRRGKRRQR